ncbi:MAG: hypothetical protein JWN40_4635 [Phycisphaerales bacterium]|nr:hypothetical protein [Phycisphaerales bacterium]
MREMSASAQQTTTFTVPTGVTVSDPVPDSANPDPRVIETQPAAAPPTPIATAAAVHPAWRHAIVGFILIILATALGCAIPRFHLKAGLGEIALVLLAIATLIVGAALVTGCFVRNMIRNL